MSKSIFWRPLALFLLLAAVSAHAQFTPTTTMAAEQGNNTSAADSFAVQTNGNAGAGNISKISTRTQLYSGSTSKIFAHWMPWYGGAEHMNVGYSSGDTTQIQKQVNDMLSRGIEGAVVDWYGSGASSAKFKTYDLATQGLMHEAEQHSGFLFAIMMDFGALQTCAATTGCDVTQTLIDNLNYANTTYFASPAYLQYNGRPVLYFFGQETYTVDWTRVRSNVAGNPIFVFRNAGAFTLTQSDGGFAWAAVSAATASDPLALNYLDNFYQTARSHSSMYSTGAGYKGFNDSLAPWGTGRIMSQQCGQTWLKTLAEAGKYYSSSSQMYGIQLVTWNDYEEGTEIETGIDNCVTVSASSSGSVLSWSITGDPSTVDHFVVLVSQDGQNLMPLPKQPVSATSLDLGNFNLPAGDYTVYVEAVGQPSMVNKFSSAVQLTIGSGVPTPTPTPTPAPTPTPTATPTPTPSPTATPTPSPTPAPTPSPSPTPTATPTPTPTPTPANQPPHAVLSLSSGSILVGGSITANTSGSTDSDGTIVSRSINFGDGTVTTATSASHQYKRAGSYTVTATVTDNKGASASASATVTVKAQFVQITAPTSTSLIGSSQRISGTAFSGYKVTQVAIYVDTILKFRTTTSATATATVSMGIGKHTIVVQAWDSSSATFRSQISVTRTK